jgi:hypothetical protein
VHVNATQCNKRSIQACVSYIGTSIESIALHNIASRMIELGVLCEALLLVGDTSYSKHTSLQGT